MSGTFEHFISMLFQTLQTSLTGGSVKHTRLTETASSDTAALNFQNYTVLRHFYKWHQGGFRIGGRSHICLHLLIHRSRYICANWFKSCNCTIFLISHLIQPRHINATDLRSFDQEFFSGTAFFTASFI